MKPAKIYFFAEDTHFNLKDKLKYKRWISAIAQKENKAVNSLIYIFCSDKYLLFINNEYLNKDDYTDVIAFDLHKEKGKVNGEIYISVDRVRENAVQYGISFEQELRRVMAHGLLHLIGYTDKNTSGKQKMREKEDFYIATFETIA